MLGRFSLATHAAPQPGRHDRPDPKPGRSTHQKPDDRDDATRALSCIAASRLILQYCEYTMLSHLPNSLIMSGETPAARAAVAPPTRSQWDDATRCPNAVHAEAIKRLSTSSCNARPPTSNSGRPGSHVPRARRKDTSRRCWMGIDRFRPLYFVLCVRLTCLGT